MAAAKSDKDDKSDEKKKGGKKKLVIIALPVLLLAGAAAYFLVLSPKPAQATSAKAKAAAAKALAALPPVLVSGPSVTTNLSDGHVVEASVQLSFIHGTLPATVTAVSAQMKSAMIQALAAWTYPALLAPSGRTKLKAELITDLNAILATQPTKEKILNLYFTNFIMQ
ncbi:MAG: flagellar basal body-associated FliL family protein [Acidimicrobiales bacterium]